MALYVHEAGSVDGPAIVFIHGGGLSGRMWVPQMERLTDFHCLAPDLPEHGLSAASGPFTLQAAADEIAGLIHERTKLGRAHIVGLSVGGAVALTLLGSAPEVVDHVVLSSPSPRFGRFLALVSKFMMVYLPKLIGTDRNAEMVIKSQGIPETYSKMIHEDMRIFTVEASRHLVQSLSGLEMPKFIAAPTLVAVGEKELAPVKRFMSRILNGFPEARGVTAPGLDHIWSLQAPGLFADMVRAWVTDRPLPATLRPFSSM